MIMDEATMQRLLQWAALDDYHREYEALLVQELEEVVGIAHAHGWKSTRYDRGVMMRSRIAEMRKLLGVYELSHSK